MISEAMASLCCKWIQGDTATTRRLDEPAPDDGGLREHRLQTTAITSACRARLPIATGGDFVFSAWIRIPEEFRGRQIGAQLVGFSSNALWSADLKSRGNWQRVWVTATLPPDARYIACELIAEGAIGYGFQPLAGIWSAEPCRGAMGSSSWASAADGRGWQKRHQWTSRSSLPRGAPGQGPHRPTALPQKGFND
jgi:hypothetical protein